MEAGLAGLMNLGFVGSYQGLDSQGMSQICWGRRFSAGFEVENLEVCKCLTRR